MKKLFLIIFMSAFVWATGFAQTQDLNSALKFIKAGNTLREVKQYDHLEQSKLDIMLQTSTELPRLHQPRASHLQDFHSQTA